MSEPTCDGCRFWVYHGDPQKVGKDSVGQCRRHAPPQSLPESCDRGLAAGWITTWANEWCGDHENRGAPPGYDQERR